MSIILSSFVLYYYFCRFDPSSWPHKQSKSQDLLKRLLPDGSTGGLVVSKALVPNLNFSSLNRISLLLIQVATQLSSRGWMDPVPDLILPEKFLGYSRESNPGLLGWQSDVLTTIPNRWSSIELPNISTGKSAAAFRREPLNDQYWDVFSCKPSPEAWTTIFNPRGLGMDLQKANLKWR